LQPNTDQPVEVATLTIAGYVVLAGGAIERRTFTLPIRVSGEAVQVEDAEVRAELLKLRAARAREEALEDRDRGDFVSAAMKLQGVAQALLERPDEESREQALDLQRMAELFEAGAVDPRDVKYMHQRAASLRKSRPRAGRVISRVRRKPDDA